jgi:glutamate-ammonia-ligase adenylyltransferase
MGSFGSDEMTFSSDIDLIFVTDNLKSNPDEQNIFLDYLNKLREAFKPATVDCRLRPEGKSGMLVWDVSAYVNYIYGRARIWELQALTKLSFIKGNRKIYNRIRTAVVKRLNSEKKEIISIDLMQMRKKMLPAAAGFSDMINLKKSAGGIIDIEFILQYLILCSPHLYKSLSAKRVSTVINGLIRNYPESADSLLILKKNHRFLKSLMLYNQDIFNQTGSLIVKQDLKFRKLAAAMRLNSGSDLEKELIRIMKENSTLFKKVIG